MTSSYRLIINQYTMTFKHHCRHAVIFQHVYHFVVFVVVAQGLT